jgi:hypothetical protein
MAQEDFVPRADDKFLEFHDHLTAEAGKPGSIVPAGDKTTLQADNTKLHQDFLASDTADAAAKAATATKKATRATAERNVRTMSRQWKAGAAYTEAIGNALKVHGPEHFVDLSNAKPKLKGRAVAGGAEIGFDKGDAEGVKLFSKRDGDADWVPLGVEMHSPYVDNRPLLVAGKPESRRYRGIFIAGDEPVGQWSDEIVVTAAG